MVAVRLLSFSPRAWEESFRLLLDTSLLSNKLLVSELESPRSQIRNVRTASVVVVVRFSRTTRVLQLVHQSAELR